MRNLPLMTGVLGTLVEHSATSPTAGGEWSHRLTTIFLGELTSCPFSVSVPE